MATSRTPYGLKVEEMLADGEWHDREQLVAAAVRVVPPGVATRAARAEREGSRRRHLAGRGGVAGPHKGGGPAQGDDMRVGSRRIVVHLISTLVGKGKLERRDHEGVIQIRRRPETGGE